MKNNQNIYLKTKDFLLSGEAFVLLENSEGDMLQTFPIPDNLNKYYDTENYISHTDSKKSFFDKAYQFVKRISINKKIKLIHRLNNGSGSLLDIGTGTGDFLVAAKNKNWKVRGVEPNDFARNMANQKGVQVSEELHNINQETFDVITLWHVLEHINDLDEYIKKIKLLLKENGVLIVAVPNFKSKDAKIYKEYWAAFDVPRHLWHFSKTSIKRIFDLHNMKLLQTKPMWFDAYYVCLLSEKYKTNKNNWLKAFWNGTRSNCSGIFTKEYSSHIYVIKSKT